MFVLRGRGNDLFRNARKHKRSSITPCSSVSRLSTTLISRLRVHFQEYWRSFAHNPMRFPRWDVVRVPLGQGGISFGNVLLQTTGDRKEG
jgi:hypothetical protein